MKIKLQSNTQLELSIQNARPCRPLTRRQRRLQIASFWFRRMRHVVDSAIDRSPRPVPPPQQSVFPQLTRSI